MNHLTRFADFVGGFPEFEFSFCDVAVTASLYGVGVVVGEGLSLLARVESEDAAGVFGCGLLSEA